MMREEETAMGGVGCLFVCLFAYLLIFYLRKKLGDLPLLVPRMQNLNGNITVKEAVKGTKTSYECSLHGKCNRQTGECECDSGW